MIKLLRQWRVGGGAAEKQQNDRNANRFYILINRMGIFEWIEPVLDVLAQVIDL